MKLALNHPKNISRSFKMVKEGCVFPTLEIEKFEGSSEKRGDEKTDHIITKVYLKRGQV